MADEPIVREINYLRLFPWLRLFRGAGLALDLKKLVLASLGLIVLHVGWQGLNALFPGSRPITPTVLTAPALGLPLDRAFLVAELASAPARVAEPWRWLIAPFLAIFASERDGWTFLHGMLAAVWAVAVWGLIGGSIVRIAVVEVARSEGVGLVEALRFAVRKAFPLMTAPLAPFLAIAIAAVFCMACGGLYRIPSRLGPIAAGVLACLPLLAGLFMAITLVGLAFGWPLMHATIAAESEDTFDALSRSYGYLNQRPGRYAAYVALAWGLGSVGLVLVDLAARLVVHLARWGLGFVAPADMLAGLWGGGTVPVDPMAAALHTFWLQVVGLLAHAWVYSYFWTSAAIIYLLLRRDVDGKPWHEVDDPARASGQISPQRHEGHQESN